MEETEVIVVNDVIDLKGAPHTVCEISRETLSTIPEKTDEELYAQEEEKEEDPAISTPPVVDGDD